MNEEQPRYFALGRPRTRPPVRRVTVEIDADILRRVEEQAIYNGASLRTAVEVGLRLLLEKLERERTGQ